MDRDRAVLEVGTELAGRYLVEALLGSGGMGAVYKVLDRAIGERVALKVLAFSGEDDGVIDRFKREVRLARRITHRNVARTFDLGQHEGLFFLTMELFSGETLRDRIRTKKRLSLPETLGITRQIAEGLVAAHAAGVIHRDLKPLNVMLEPDGRVAILDFGVARSIHDFSSTQHPVGTPAYMAPEQIFGPDVDVRTDLFALGLMIHEMLTGSLPKFGKGAKDLTARFEGAKPEIDLALVPSDLAGLVRALTDPDRNGRPPSAQAMLRVINGISALGQTVSDGPAILGETRFAPIPEVHAVVSVLPFRERGERAQGLGEAVSEELVDTLSRAKGFRVLSSRATAHFGAEADPARVGRELHSDYIVEGTVQRSDETVRITARLVDAKSGVQLWSERFEGGLEDALSFQDRTARRIAEALRGELGVAADRGRASAEAIELYFHGRHRTRALDLEGMTTLERACELAPSFRPATAGLALAMVRRAFPANTPSALELAEKAVSRALSEARDLPETHLAAAVLRSHMGDFQEAAKHLRIAVTLAPTFAEAQEYLGMLQCEAGRAAEGIKHIELAMELDPVISIGVSVLARHHFFRGRMADFAKAMKELEHRSGGRGPLWAMLSVRTAAWQRDLELLDRARAAIPVETSPAFRALAKFAELVLKPSLDVDGVRSFAADSALFITPRFAALFLQFAAEVAGLHGDGVLALEFAEHAASGVFSDLEWLEFCPVLEPARKLPGFVDVQRLVRDRTLAIWAG